MIARTASSLLLLLLLSVSTASAQSYLQPIASADDPKAQVATELVERLLQGDRDAAKQYIEEHGVELWATGQLVDRELDRVMNRLKGKDYQIDRLDKGNGKDIVVWLKGEKGGDNVVIRMEKAKDPKIAGFGQVVIDEV